MNICSLIIGYLVSVAGGAVVLWLLVDTIAWGYLEKHDIPKKKRGVLTVPMGLIERFLYTTVFLLNQPGFVAVWLALKVASQWKRWKDEERGTYNVFLIGSGLNLIISFVGAWIALGSVPLIGSN